MHRLVPLGILLTLTGVARAEEPRAIIERAIKAAGGEELLSRKMATVVKFGGVIWLSPGDLDLGALPMGGELLTQMPAARRCEVVVDWRGAGGIMAAMDGGKQSMCVVFADAKAWSPQAGGLVKDIPEDETFETHADGYGPATGLLSVFKDKGYLLSLLKDNNATLTGSDDAAVEGRRAVGVKVARKGQPDLHLHFDKETALLIKIGFKNKQGNLLETIHSNYRDPGKEDDERAARAAGIPIDGAGVLAYLRRQAPDPAKVEKVKALICKLGDDSFEVREQASRDLVEFEKAAVPFLEQALKRGDVEVARRAAECLKKVEKLLNNGSMLAAIRLAGWTRMEGAAEALLAILPATNEATARDIKAVLVVYAEGKPDPALVRALNDKDPSRRSAAQAVLGKDDGAFLMEPGRRLFLCGLKQPMRHRSYINGKLQLDVQLFGFRVVNRLDPKLFEKPGKPEEGPTRHGRRPCQNGSPFGKKRAC